MPGRARVLAATAAASLCRLSGRCAAPRRAAAGDRTHVSVLVGIAIAGTPRAGVVSLPFADGGDTIAQIWVIDGCGVFGSPVYVVVVGAGAQPAACLR